MVVAGKVTVGLIVVAGRLGGAVSVARLFKSSGLDRGGDR